MHTHITHVVGARPNFVKAAPVIRALTVLGHRQRVVHTGQHYDERMSEVFFGELGLPVPDVNLGVGSGSHARQTAAIMTGLEPELSDPGCAITVVYGDVNSTMAAALVAAKLGVPLAHVEAGLRSFDWSMPEEVNRRVTDQLCDLLFVTSPEAVGHLANEGIPVTSVQLTGNPMIDTLQACLDRLDTTGMRARHSLGGVMSSRPCTAHPMWMTRRSCGTWSAGSMRSRRRWMSSSRCTRAGVRCSRRPGSMPILACMPAGRLATWSSWPCSGARPRS